MNKNILLISPQPWDHIFISKHHYAEELIKNNNRVFFLEPPSEDISMGVKVRKHKNLDNLFIVSWRAIFPRAIRFHLYSLYIFLMSLQVRLIKKKIDRPLDIVWSFDFNLYPDLREFGAKLAVFHPVDPLSNQRQIDIGVSADLIISVSEKILKNFDESKFFGKTLLINHGLGRAFTELANSPASRNAQRIGEINVGYFGNLDRPMINLKVWVEIIRKNPKVTFHFWGPYEADLPFELAMRVFNNVILHGKISKQELSIAVGKMDCFLLIYSEDNLESDRSNSHKILEYLATGKVVISSRIDAYIGCPNLVKMPIDGDDNMMPLIFSEVISKLDDLNSEKLMAARKHYAANFTYENNLKKIDHWVDQKNLVRS